MKDSTRYNVRAIERAMEILACFDAEHPEMTLSEIARTVRLSPATTLRMLVTLQSGAYVDRTTNGEKYRLGLRIVEMGLDVARRLEIRRLAKPHLVALEKRFRETCDLSLFSRGAMLCVDVVSSGRTLGVAASPGFHSPLHCTASGKVYLADLPSAEAASLLSDPLRRYTGKTITDPNALLAQLPAIRALGYGIDDEELTMGVRAAAAPIWGRDGRVAGVLGISGPAERMGDEILRDIAEALIAAANAIHAHLDAQAEHSRGDST